MEDWLEQIDCFLFACDSTEQVDSFFGWFAFVFMVTQHQVIFCVIFIGM
jgi:hypothetical protein